MQSRKTNFQTDRLIYLCRFPTVYITRKRSARYFVIQMPQHTVKNRPYTSGHMEENKTERSHVER